MMQVTGKSNCKRFNVDKRQYYNTIYKQNRKRLCGRCHCIHRFYDQINELNRQDQDLLALCFMDNDWVVSCKNESYSYDTNLENGNWGLCDNVRINGDSTPIVFAKLLIFVQTLYHTVQQYSMCVVNITIQCFACVQSGQQ